MIRRRVLPFVMLALIGAASISAIPRAKSASETSPPAQSAGFKGNVEVHSIKLSEGEEIVQIIDNDRAVVCYGKVSQGGTSSVSCQRTK